MTGMMYFITAPLKITVEDIDDIIQTAQDGGYSWFDGFAKVADGWIISHEDVNADEAETFTTTTISYETLATAVEAFLANRIIDALRFENEFAHTIDVNDADSIVQRAVYDEIVFA